MLSLISGRLGTKALPENHILVDWPITYSQLEPYYDRVEWELGISGRGSNIADGSGSGHNLWEAPRARDYPMPPLRQGPADQRFSDACSRLAFHPFRTAAAIAESHSKGGLVAPIVVSATAIPAMEMRRLRPMSLPFPRAWQVAILRSWNSAAFSKSIDRKMASERPAFHSLTLRAGLVNSRQIRW